VWGNYANAIHIFVLRFKFFCFIPRTAGINFSFFFNFYEFCLFLFNPILHDIVFQLQMTCLVVIQHDLRWILLRNNMENEK